MIKATRCVGSDPSPPALIPAELEEWKRKQGVAGGVLAWPSWMQIVARGELGTQCGSVGVVCGMPQAGCADHRVWLTWATVYGEYLF